jgi:hypothetical protein
MNHEENIRNIRRAQLDQLLSGDAHMAGGGLLNAAAKAAKPAAKAVTKAAQPALEIRPPSDSIRVVRESNFTHSRLVGNQNVKIGDLSGGVRLSDPQEKKRVKDLADKISSPDGYISRIIVDQDNNVIEGQHRLEALRQLGVQDVPVYKIEDLEATMPVDKMKSAMSAVGPIHSDHVNQLVDHALEHISEGGMNNARQMNYGKFQKHYDAALDAAVGMQPVLPTAERDANLAKMLEGSKVKDRLYHATPKDFSAFKPGGDNPKISGEAIWLSSDPTYQAAAHHIGDPRKPKAGVQVMPVHVQAKNPMMLDDKDMLEWAQSAYAGGSKEFPELMPKQWADDVKKDYDSIIYADPHGRGDPHEIIMFEPEKIKSAIGNRGTYDTNEPDLNKAGGGLVHLAGGGDPRKRGLFPKMSMQAIVNSPGFDPEVPSDLSRAYARRMAEKNAYQRSMADQKLTPAQRGTAGLEATGMLGSAMFEGVQQLPKLLDGEEAYTKAVGEGMYQPRFQPEKAAEYVGNVADFLEKLETEYKMPQLLPELLPFTGAAEAAKQQAKKAVKQGAKKAVGALGSLAKSEAGQKLAQKALESPFMLPAANPMYAIKQKGGNWVDSELQRSFGLSLIHI